MFETLGFTLTSMVKDDMEEAALEPPVVDPTTPEGRANRAKLLRAWTEIGAWLAIQEKSSESLGETWQP